MAYDNKTAEDFLKLAQELLSKCHCKLTEKTLARYLLKVYNEGYDDSIRNQL